jgi:hypothetical protein
VCVCVCVFVCLCVCVCVFTTCGNKSTGAAVVTRAEALVIDALREATGPQSAQLSSGNNVTSHQRQHNTNSFLFVVVARHAPLFVPHVWSMLASSQSERTD